MPVPSASANRLDEQTPRAGVLEQVGRQLGRDERDPPGLRLVEPARLARSPARRRAWPTWLGSATATDRVALASRMRSIYFQRAIVISRVPRPTAESISNSLDSRFAPLRPRPRPPPVV